MNAKTWIPGLVALCLVGVLGPAMAQSSDGRTVRGLITSITVDDPSNTRGSTSAEGRYAVRLTLDSLEGTVLGFAQQGKSNLPAQQAMLDLALLAFDRQWPVTLQLDRPVESKPNNARATGSSRSHVRIVAISASRY